MKVAEDNQRRAAGSTPPRGTSFDQSRIVARDETRQIKHEFLLQLGLKRSSMAKGDDSDLLDF